MPKKGEKSAIFSFYCRFIADFFNQNTPVRHVLHSHDFSMEKLVFSDFSAKNRRFYRFFANFLTSDYLLQKSFSCWLKTDFSAIFQPKNPIFLSLIITMHSHPFHALSLCMCNATCHFMLIPCHIYDECYMDNSTRAYHPCIMDNYIKHACNLHKNSFMSIYHTRIYQYHNQIIT